MDDRYRARRSPDRNAYGRGPYPPPSDSYVPGGRRRSRSPPPYRRRSRTPPRPQADTWTPRARTPPRRYDPRNAHSSRDARLRSPRRTFDSSDDRYPPRARSPALKRDRELSPINARPRSPPPKRERLHSPIRDFGRARSPPRRNYTPPRDRPPYRPRSRSPARRDDLYASKTWRRRSPSPSRPLRGPHNSGLDSMAASRRSSPHPPPRHLGGTSDYNSPRDPSDYSHGRPASPGQRNVPPLGARASRVARSPFNDSANTTADPVVHDPLPHRERQSTYHPDQVEAASVPPVRHERPTHSLSASPPRHTHAASPPTGPSNAPIGAMNGNPMPPSGPSSLSRGGSGFHRGGRGGGPSREYPPRDFASTRGGGVGRGSAAWGSAPSGPGFGRGGPPNRVPDTFSSRGPSMPREQYESHPQHAARGRDHSYGGYRGSSNSNNNSTSSTYPRTQRFNVAAALSDLPKLKQEGEKLPPLFDFSKADRLEEEAARLRKLIDDKAGERRRSLREWERLSTAVKAAGERSDVVEQELRLMSGEGMSGVAF